MLSDILSQVLYAAAPTHAAVLLVITSLYGSAPFNEILNDIQPGRPTRRK